MKHLLSSIFFLGLAIMSGQVSAKTCTYRLFDSPELTWTGYKFNNKTPVSGTFKRFEVKTVETAPSVADVLGNGFFYIQTSLIDAGLPARNTNIMNGLFAKLVGGKSIRGLVQSVDAKKQELIMGLWMNGKMHSVPMSYSWAERDGKFSLTGSIDLLKMGMNDAFKSLATTCSTWHKGSDGVTKTWSEVALEVKGRIVKECR